MYDYCIIGGGVIGCSIARELSRYETKVVLVEKGYDVCTGTSGANSGIVHAGYDAPTGSLMAKFNVLGVKLMPLVTKMLDVHFEKTGSLVVATDENEGNVIRDLLKRGKDNGVNDLRIIGREEIVKLCPDISDGVKEALYAPSAGIVNPFELTFALKENAEANGVEFRFDFEAVSFREGKGCGVLVSGKGDEISAKTFINAAGLGGEKVSALFGVKEKINFRMGEYLLFDHPSPVRMPVFQTPTEKGKGVLVCPTTSDNWFIGPSAIIEPEPLTAIRRTAEDELLYSANKSMKNLPLGKKITSFAGVRAVSPTGDFVIGRANEHLYNAIGICSPGLSSAPAIGSFVARSFGLKEKKNFNPKRKGIERFAYASDKRRRELIESDSRYGNIVCRCEVVSEAEIVEAIKRGARTIDGLKKRLRTGMGRCQGGFCTPRLIEIMSRELIIEPEKIVRKEEGSNYLFPKGADK